MTVIVTGSVALGAVPFAACTVNMYVPCAVGVPLRTPELELMVTPDGGVPLKILHVMVGLPVAEN